MIIFPAIDIRKGKCVRLEQGNFAKEQIYGEDPVEVAKKWENQGARYLHLVDLDGACRGIPQHKEIIGQIVRVVKIPVQVGGGIRTIQDIKNMLDLGVERVILGTSAVAEDGFIEKAVARFGKKIVVSIDAKNGYVAVDGWTKTSGLKAVEFAKKLEEKGLTTIIYTDIAKDGMLLGPNDAALALLKKNISMKLIASGGISSIEDVKKLEKLGIDGAIIGKALYTGHIALEILQEGLK